MTNRTANVIGGVDTHKHTHYAAVIDDHGKQLGHREFPAHAGGYAALLAGCGPTVTWPRSAWRAPGRSARP